MACWSTVGPPRGHTLPARNGGLLSDDGGEEVIVCVVSGSEDKKAVELNIA